jgi:hypothetical protein
MAFFDPDSAVSSGVSPQQGLELAPEALSAGPPDMLRTEMSWILTRCQECPMIETVIDVLLNSQNPDGGWGVTKSRRSNTEATTFTLLGLSM